jgi:hypothetical protein
MPIPMISPQILASSKAVDDGWTLFELMAVRNQASKDGKSVNYFWEFEAVQGPNSSQDNKGRRATNTVNTAGLETGITAACNNYIGMISCLTGLSAEDLVGQSVDEQALIGKKIWADIGTTIRDGKPQKNFNAFCPSNVIPY